jgi:hypothetical protein
VISIPIPERDRDFGTFGSGYGIQREDEDLAAIVEHTGAECVFGPANGGLFALHGGIGLGQVRRIGVATSPYSLPGKVAAS